MFNLLLVEDNKADARLVQAWLQASAAPPTQCHHVTYLKDAVQALQEATFDAVVLDMSLPDSEGIENLDRIREVTATLPVVVLTGRDDEAFGLTALQHGAQDYLVKGRHGGDYVSRSVRYAIERKRLEEELIRLAHYDQVTGLANRIRFIDRLEHALARAKRQDEVIALLYIDLDGFKAINDSYGHTAGDWLLAAVGERMKSSVRDADTVARLGGDEFAILVESLDSVDGASIVAQKLLAGIAAPYDFNGAALHVSASIGISVFPESGQTAETLLHNADIAMYRSKQAGRNRFQLCTPQMRQESQSRQRTEQALEEGLRCQEFELHYQPRVSAGNGTIAGLEALLRWRSNGELRMPGEFIPVLERSGLIVEVGDWVFDAVCRQVADWLDAGLAVPPVSVNLSGHQLRDVDLPQRFQATLRNHAVAADAFEMEITETLLLGDDPVVKRVLMQLRELGFRIAIDDFGAGYCSFGYLREFPVDIIKVDRGFVSGVTADSTDARLVGGIIRLAQDMALKVVVEGVEQQHELNSVAAFGPDEFQGFLFHRPLLPVDIAELLQFSTTSVAAGGTVLPH